MPTDQQRSIECSKLPFIEYGVIRTRAPERSETMKIRRLIREI